MDNSSSYSLKSELLKVLDVLSPLANENLIEARAVIRRFEQVLSKDEEMESVMQNLTTGLQLGTSSKTQQQSTTINSNSDKRDFAFKSPSTNPDEEKSSNGQKDAKSSNSCSGKRGLEQQEVQVSENLQRKKLKSSHNISTQTTSFDPGESSTIIFSTDNNINNQVSSGCGGSSSEDFNTGPNLMEDESHENSTSSSSNDIDDETTRRDESYSAEETIPLSMDTAEAHSVSFSESKDEKVIKMESAETEDVNIEPEAVPENSIIDLLLQNINMHNKSSIAQDFWKCEAVERNVNISKFHIRVNSFNQKSSEFTFFIQEKTQLLAQPRVYSRLTFGQLKRKLKSSSSYMMKIHAQFRPADLQNQQVLEFFSLFGKYISHFSFDQKLGELDMVNDISFLCLLSENTRNLEYLAVDDQSIHRAANSPSSSSSFSSTFNSSSTSSGCDSSIEPFLHLTTLEFINTKFGFSQPFITTIFQSCPGLTNIIQLPLKFLTLAVEHGKNNGEIKSVFLECSEYYTGLECYKSDLNKLKNLNLELDQLVMPLYCDVTRFNNSSCAEWVEISMDYHSLLKRSSNTLEKLDIEPRSPIDLSKFPMHSLYKLKTLRLNLYNLSINYPTKWILNKWDLNLIFPEVENLEVNYENYGNVNSAGRIARMNTPSKFFKDYFPSQIYKPGISLPRVKSLKLMNTFPVECLRNMMELFPSIETLIWKCNLMTLREILPEIFHLQPNSKIKEIVIQLDLGQRKEFLFQYLDSELTGMSSEKCDELRNRGEDGEEISSVDIEKFRIESSILKLKDLELFQIIFCQPTGSPETRLFSKVAGIYGFGMRGQSPNLKVEFGFDPTCTASYRKQVVRELRAILPFVTNGAGELL